MNNTIQVTIQIENESQREELIARLTALSFDAFEEKEEQLEAFIEEKKFEEKQLREVLLPYNLPFTSTIIEEQNWNALWESNFQPVLVDTFCGIRAEFHPPFTDVENEIIITPKMSFGTGHHATTYMMISEMRRLDFKGKQIADFGTGTGVLAILADKLGGENIWAVDYDDWSIQNALENVDRNCCTKVVVEKNDYFSSPKKFDIILANINKHVILNNTDELKRGLAKEGKLLLSGLLKEDEDDIVKAFTTDKIGHVTTVARNNWICLLFVSN